MYRNSKKAIRIENEERKINISRNKISDVKQQRESRKSS